MRKVPNMPEKIKTLKKPGRLARLALRAPIWVYRANLGWLFGHRFVLLTHFGRNSGLPRQTVLEIVRYDKATGACVVASGWGTKSDWFHNVMTNPQIVIQVQNKPSTAIAERLLPEAGAQELLYYAHRHPLALRELANFMGYRLDGTEDDIRSLGRLIPMFIFKPTSFKDNQANPEGDKQWFQ
jgi:deazaflavin-dependent oxidoreductase (nitroreductase family)